MRTVVALLAAGQVVRDGAMLRLPGHEARLTREDERLWERVRPLLAAGGICARRGSASWPPRLGPRTGAAHPVSLKRAERFGRVAAGCRQPGCFLPEDDPRASRISAAALAEDSPERSFTASGFKDRSGIGRNLTIEVLEYLRTRSASPSGSATHRIVLRAAPTELFRLANRAPSPATDRRSTNRVRV